MKKSIKIDGDLKYLSIIVPSMIGYINRKDGINIGWAKNHHTVQFTLNTGENVTAHAYETKTLIVIDWSLAK